MPAIYTSYREAREYTAINKCIVYMCVGVGVFVVCAGDESRALYKYSTGLISHGYPMTYSDPGLTVIA